MKMRLQEAGLLGDGSEISDIDIKVAWSVLSKIGYPARFCGRSQDGSYEYVIIDPKTGSFLATGKGSTLEYSICEAALNATSHLKENQAF